MSKLVYHNVENRDSISPFDREIKQMVNGQTMSIVSPYIGLAYLEELVKISKKDWRLLTDFQEWILSHPSGKQRESIVEFIIDNHEKVKHVRNIHAKVVITSKSAFIGSANLTESGVLKRTEMSIVLSEKDKLVELQDWFDELWDISTDFTENQLLNFLKENLKVNYNITVEKLPLDTTAKLNKKVNFFSIQNLAKTNEEYESDLKFAVEKQTDKNYLNKYLDFIKQLFDELRIEKDSKKITMSTTQQGKMPITIGQRYIAIPKNGTVGLIFPLDFDDYSVDYPNATIVSSFTTNKEEQALWVYFSNDDVFNDKNLYEDWKKAVNKELDRTTVSGYRRAHNPFYYKAVMDSNYRSKLLGLK